MLTSWIIQTLNFQNLWSSTIKLSSRITSTQMYLVMKKNKPFQSTYQEKKSIMYSSKISRCSCITKQNVNTENTLARTVCNVSAVRRHLQTKNWLYRDKWKVGSKNAWKGNNTLKFNSSHKQLPVPFLIYADFEAITEKAHTCVPDNHESYTEAY